METALSALWSVSEPNSDDPLKQAKAKAADTYDAASDHFDDEPLAFWECIGRQTIDRLDLQHGAKVLDVGCGAGSSALPSAETIGPTGFVTGVDLSARLLARAREKAVKCSLSNIEFQLADMTSLSYPDGHFDAVVSVFSIFFVPDMEGLVRELWRMVRPGGKLAITTWGPRIFEPAYSRWLEAIKDERPDLHSAFNPWDRITDVELSAPFAPGRRHWKIGDRSGEPVSVASLSRRLVDHRSWIRIAMVDR